MAEFVPNDANEPMLVDLTGIFVGHGLHAVAVTIPEEAPAPFGGQRGVLFQFGVPGVDHVRVFLPLEAVSDDLGFVLQAVVNDAHDKGRMDAAAARAREANLRAGRIPGGPVIYCPGCNSRLFGEIARRGGCLGCYPVLADS